MSEVKASTQRKPERIYAYVDGFNLYHALAQFEGCKWLNLDCAVKIALKVHNLRGSVEKVKLFSAPTLPDMGGADKAERQRRYFDALKHHLGERMEIIEGRFVKHPQELTLVKGKVKGETALVYVRREKKTDVNLAVHMLNDAWEKCYDRAVLVSSDADFTEALRLVHKKLRKKSYVIHTSKNPPAAELREHATAYPLSKKNLQKSQLPNEVEDPVSGRILRRPKKWR